MLSLLIRVDQGAMAMKGYSLFPKAPRLEPHHQIIDCHGGYLMPNHFYSYIWRYNCTLRTIIIRYWKSYNCVQVLYNCEMIFFILSFFVGYILSFGLVRLRTIRLGTCTGTHIERMCSCSRTEDVTITDFIIKTPDGKWDWDVNDVMPGNDGLGILVIF